MQTPSSKEALRLGQRYKTTLGGGHTSNGSGLRRWLATPKQIVNGTHPRDGDLSLVRSLAQRVAASVHRFGSLLSTQRAARLLSSSLASITPTLLYTVDQIGHRARERDGVEATGRESS